MKLIVGLGNPGREYARTRHNAGFMAVERLAGRHGLSGEKNKFHAVMVEGAVAGERCVLLEPQTFMNRSGLSVGEAVAFYKVELSDVIILVDDVALPCGRIRVRGEGGAGGHNGLADVERALGTAGYPRVRIGIDPPVNIPMKDYVLGQFSEEQLGLLNGAIEKTCDAVECWVKEGIEKAMSRYNPGE